MSFVAVGVVVGAVALTAAPSAIGAISANREKKRSAKEKTRRELELKELEKNRQEIIDPTRDMTNPFAALQVSTRASEFKAEQTDIALANVLDTLRATGGGGGATGLAIQAARSKEAIAADIERQEIENERLRAQGQQQLEAYKARGQEFMFNMREDREIAGLDRAQAMYDEQRMMEQYYKQQQMELTTQAISEGVEGGVEFYSMFSGATGSGTGG
jgi:hypothetical protein